MRVFKSQNKNRIYLIYRLIRPIFDPIKFYQGITGYYWYIRDMYRYNSRTNKKIRLDSQLFPILDEKVSLTPFDAHYFYQELWVFENILKKKPLMHIDIGSSYHMSGYLSKIVKSTFVDLRPIPASLKNLDIKKGDILKLPYKNDSITSLSCLHVAEHIGLGRYGDEIDPEGTKKACTELTRVLAKGGRLFFSLPIGKDRVCFNAHRVQSVKTIKNYFNKLKLESFSVVDDDGKFHENVNINKFSNMNYGCGLFMFTKD